MGECAMRSVDTNRNRMLAVIAIILAVAALRASYPVTMPLTASILLIAAIWPLKLWLDRLGRAASYVGTSLILLLILALFFATLYFSTAQLVQAFGDNWGELEAVYRTAMGSLKRWGISGVSLENRSRLIGFGQNVLSNASTILIYLGFIAILVMLGLPEVTAMAKKIDQEIGEGQIREIRSTINEIAHKVRQYLGITLVTSLLTGVASALWALAIGLELPLVWGTLNFLLNFIPVVGNFAGIVPPTVYALIPLAGFCFIQIGISNFIYPMLQGRSLSLSPVAVVLSLAFWSWVWGLAGAFIAIPLTVSLVIICGEFEGTRWIAVLLSSVKVEASERLKSLCLPQSDVALGLPRPGHKLAGLGRKPRSRPVSEEIRPISKPLQRAQHDRRGFRSLGTLSCPAH
jgi:predicted PurR-regulated permease PerM